METLTTTRRRFLKDLHEIYDPDEIESIFFICLEWLLQKSRLDFFQEREFKISEADKIQFGQILQRLKSHEPIQYILGKTEFFGLRFKVNQQVLIPRQETEELVDLIMRSESTSQRTALNILDIGTGSGCIAVALKSKLTEAKVFGIDISAEAIELAKENAIENGVNIFFKEHDILSKKALVISDEENTPLKFDIIASNPPYVRESEKHEIKPNVLNYEPALALFVGDDNPLIFYDAISDFAVNNLTDKGWLYFEINQYLGEQMKQMLQEKGFTSIKIQQDLLGNDRMLKAQLG